MTGCVGWSAGWGWAVLAPADWLSYWSSVAGTVPASASTLHPSHRLDQDTPHPPLILSFCHGRQVLHLDFVVFRFKNIDPSLNIWDYFFVGSVVESVYQHLYLSTTQTGNTKGSNMHWKIISNIFFQQFSTKKIYNWQIAEKIFIRYFTNISN